MFNTRRFLIASIFVSAACGSSAPVKTDKALPVKRVVLYRNGVGYFERAGKHQGDELAFEVKKKEVGDFLASLTVLDRQKGKVQSVSFEGIQPLTAPPPVYLPYDAARFQSMPAAPSEEDQRVKVKVHLSDAKTHDLQVAYVVASPIWRPSYRLVVTKDGALVQAWAVIQNVSGEAWKDVAVSLTTGAPIAFRSDLGTPIIPERPLVTDTGEVVQSVPQSETALAQSAPMPVPEAVMADEAMDKMREDDSEQASESKKADMRPSPKTASRSRRSKGFVGGGGGAPAPSASMAYNMNNVGSSVRTAASVTVLSENTTRYDLKDRQTIPDGGSTMVAILSEKVPGEEGHLYAPDGGVALSYQHPFRVARLQNTTGAMLEKGPISVLGNDAFLGQGVLDSLPRGANAFIPFAVDKTFLVESSRSYSEAEAKLIRVQRDTVTVEKFSSYKTKYTIRNGGSDPTKLWIKHAKSSGAELHKPPQGTENIAQHALVPVSVPAKGVATLELDERTPVSREVSFSDPAAAEAIALYLQGAAVDAAAGPALRRALDIRKQLVSLEDKYAAASQERDELSRNAEETRQNIKSIEKVKKANDLRDRLLKRLTELSARIDTLTKNIVEQQTTVSELRVRLSEALQDVSLTTK